MTERNKGVESELTMNTEKQVRDPNDKAWKEQQRCVRPSQHTWRDATDSKAEVFGRQAYKFDIAN
jgi:hypothetical protein